MQNTAMELVRLLSGIEQVMSSSLSDEQKADVLSEMQVGLPPEKLCINSTKTRQIIEAKIKETIDGFKTTETKSEKPKQSRKRKTPTKGAKA